LGFQDFQDFCVFCFKYVYCVLYFVRPHSFLSLEAIFGLFFVVLTTNSFTFSMHFVIFHIKQTREM